MNNKLMVFNFFNAALKVKTDKAQLIKLGDPNNPVKIWLPFSLIEINKIDDKMSEIILPEWLYLKNYILADFTDPSYL